MSLLTDVERMEKARAIKSYKDAFVNERNMFNSQMDAMIDANQPYGYWQSFIDQQERIISRMEVMKDGLTLTEQAEIDTLINAGTNIINTMKARYTTEIYNKIHGV